MCPANCWLALMRICSPKRVEEAVGTRNYQYHFLVGWIWQCHMRENILFKTFKRGIVPHLKKNSKYSYGKKGKILNPL